ncbi:ADP-ribosylation factor-like protein 3 [Drosophila eugracilis]|uniref:ADP-ribosylation factor-like protein 3 n=1 Tax=Drosophila eugracilis TaxID=29029 RepID=UPI0007E817C7|nr:ADP-ribosylation factor-like protein 3 [Drosophila eugracilis]
MGLLCAKLRDSCCCCCCCCYSQSLSNCCRISSPPLEEFQVLILGPLASGKTELGHRLSRVPRPIDDQEATNGVRCYHVTSVDPPAHHLQLTEVGGNPEMQRLWKHYYASSHALIYCFDLSSDPVELQTTFDLLFDCLQGTPQLAGKPVLLVASRHRDGVQLYDVEYAFGLEELAKSCGCPLLICHMDEPDDLQRGIRWLCHQLMARKTQLDQRIRYDVNMQVWQRRKRLHLTSGKLAQVHRHRFRRHTRKILPAIQGFGGLTMMRPSTAPPKIFFVNSKDENDTKM